MGDPRNAASVKIGGKHGLGILLSSTILTLTVAQPVLAADEAVEEFVVTAKHYVPKSNTGMKLDVPLIETPQSISVITRDQIDLLNFQNVGQAVRYTSGIVGENYGSDERYDWLTLRGFNPIQYVDGLQAPIGSVTNSGIDIWGMESVEVLKGPSSVLYGLTPPGGIINMTTRRPKEVLDGELQVLYGEHDNTQIAGDITGPFSDNIDYRLTGMYRDRHTQTDGVKAKRSYLAPSFTFKLGDNTKFTFLSYFQSDDIDGDGGGFLPAYGVVLPNPLGKVHSNRNLGEPDYNNYHRDQYGIGYDFSHTFNESVTIQQNLKYSSADATMLSVYGAGLDPNPFDLIVDNIGDYHTVTRFNFPFDEEVRSFAVDTRAKIAFATGAIDHTVLIGVDWRRYTNFSSFGFALAPSIDLFNPVYGAPITTPDMFPYTQQVQKQLGIYAQDQMKVNKWVFTLSARHDDVKATNSGVDTKDDEFSYRGGINYIFDSGIAPYIAYAKSFQPTYGAGFGGVPFEPTTGKQIEAGVKFEPRGLPEGMNAFASLAVYQLKQQNVLTPDTNPDHPPGFSSQAGEVEVKGLELEGIARFNERLSLNGSYTYTDSEVTKSNAGDEGNRLTVVPEHKFSLLADYTMQTGALAGLGGSLGVRYLSDLYGDPANTEELKTPSVTLADAVIHYDRNNWHVALNGSNIFDKEYISRCSSYSQCFYGLRRNVTLTLSRKFGDQSE